MNEHVKHLLDGASVAAAVASFFAWLPPLAALLSIVWTGLRIYESKTIQDFIRGSADED